MKHWYVVQTNPREEGVASSVLKQQGFDIYQPFMQRYVFHARKKTLKRYPLFPNYLFVNVGTSEEDLHKVRWCRGVRRILLDNYTPVPIDEDFIVGLRSLEDSEEGIIKKPVEVKSGAGGSLRSLHLMLNTYPNCPEGVVLYSGTYARRPEQRLTFMPLYYAGALGDFRPDVV